MRTVHMHSLQRQQLHACMNWGFALNVTAQHSCTCMHLCADTSGDTRSLPAVQFPSLTRNQSFLIYQRGFVSWRLMPTPIRGKKQHNSSEKARANPCSDAIITHNQIRADLNRHRTQNHIKGNSMCMALHCSQSPFFSLSALLSLILSWLSYSISSCPSVYLSSSPSSPYFSMLVTWKKLLPVTYTVPSSSLSWSSVLCRQ